MDVSSNNNNPSLNNFNFNFNSIDDNNDLLQQRLMNIGKGKHGKIQISKWVKSIRQLKKIEVTQVRLLYERYLARSRIQLKDIQFFISNNAGIWIERNGMEYLKKSEEQEDRKWYQNLMRDHFSYISIYRKSIDEINQLMRELWIIFEDSKTTPMGKIKAIRELHKLTVTSTLLIRDLSFVTKLSKYYDKDIIEHEFNQPLTRKSVHKDNNQNDI